MTLRAIRSRIRLARAHGKSALIRRSIALGNRRPAEVREAWQDYRDCVCAERVMVKVMEMRGNR